MIPVDFAPLTKRGISEETCRRYNYGVGTLEDGTPVQVAGYGRAQKFRTPDKKFMWRNRPEDIPLFGQSLWKPQKRLVITEGEIDCLSYAQAVECKWPVVSVPDGAQSAKRAVTANLEWVSGFEEVVLMFDMDRPGQEAAQEIAEVLPPGKARIAHLPRKDPNEVLLELGGAELVKQVFNAKPYHPAGIVDGMTTWIAGTGVGKSQVLREVTKHLADAHGEKVGVIALEESNKRSALGLMSLDMGVPLHLAEVREQVDPGELRACAERVLPSYAFYDHFGSLDPDVLFPKIRHLVHSMGIRWIILDHLSIMVSGMAAEGDERKRLDQLVTQLRSLCSELDIGLHIVSHLRKSGGQAHEEGGQVSLQDIRGSGAPAQLSDTVIALERDQQAESEEERNTTTVRVLKNRLTGETGVAGFLRYDADTCRMNVVDSVPTVFGDPKEAQGVNDF